MQSLRKAAHQALEALQIWQDSLTDPSAIPGWRFAVVGEKAIAALRAALAEDRSAESGKTSDHIADANKMVATSQEFRQVEPVAWLVTTEMQDGTRKTYPLTGRFKDVKAACDFGEPVPLYAAPPQRKPISTDMILATWVEECIPKRSTPELVVAFARAIIERAHGIGGDE